MPDAHLFQIENAHFGLTLVNPADVGYLDTWQSPAGDLGSGIAVTPILADLSDYETAAASWTCQMTSGAINTKPSTKTVQRKPTFCAPGAQVPTPEESQFTLDVAWYQDADITDSLSLWLFEHDTKKAYFYLGFNQAAPPTCVGIVRLAAGQIGGDPRTPLEAKLSLQCTRKPLVEKVPAPGP